MLDSEGCAYELCLISIVGHNLEGVPRNKAKRDVPNCDQ